MSRLYFVCSAYVLMILAGSSAAYAQMGTRHSEDAREPSGYKAAITAAVEEYEQKNFAEAREQFQRAHALFPNARTLRGLGLTEFELRNYVESVTMLSQALDSDVKRLEGPLRQETEVVLAKARGYVGELYLDLEPATAVVVVDGITRQLAPGKSLALKVGDHVLEFRAEGRLAERRAVQVKGGQVERLRVVLSEPFAESRVAEPAESALKGFRPGVPEHPVERPLYRRWWLWTSLGVVVAGAVVATALLVPKDTNIKQEPVTTNNTPNGVALRPSLWSH
jgi:hypothetical protein